MPDNMSEYELQRARNIQRNQEQLAQLGLVPANNPISRPQPKRTKDPEKEQICELCGKRTKKRHVCMIEDEDGTRRPVLRDRTTIVPQRASLSRASKGKAPDRLGFGDEDYVDDAYYYDERFLPEARLQRAYYSASAWSAAHHQAAESDASDGDVEGTCWEGPRWVDDAELDAGTSAAHASDAPPDPCVARVLLGLESAARKRLWMPHQQPEERRCLPRLSFPPQPPKPASEPEPEPTAWPDPD